MFHESSIALMREIKHHPKLIEHLVAAEVDDFPDQLAAIAAYLGIAVDGMFVPDQLETMCDQLYWELRNSRTQIITLH